MRFAKRLKMVRASAHSLTSFYALESDLLHNKLLDIGEFRNVEKLFLRRIAVSNVSTRLMLPGNEAPLRSQGATFTGLNLSMTHLNPSLTGLNP